MPTYKKIIHSGSSNEITADLINVTGNGTSGQFLASDGDGSMTWTSQTLPNDSTITISGTGISNGSFTTNQSSNATVTINLALNELTTETADMVGNEDYLVYLDEDNDRKMLIENVKLSKFNNDAGWTTNVGDITGVTAGEGISGGGTSGGVTLALDFTELTAISNNGIEGADKIPFYDDSVGSRTITFGGMITRMAGSGLSQDGTNAYQISLDAQLPSATTGCAGAWTVASGNITATDGNVIISGGDHQVTTPKISVQTINGHGIGSGHAVTITPTEFQVIQDLKVGGNDIKSSTGATAITLSGADVTIAGDLTVSGTTITTATETLEIADNKMVLNSDLTGSTAVDTGVVVNRADATGDQFQHLFWDETKTAWCVGSDDSSSAFPSTSNKIMLNVENDGAPTGTETSVGGIVYDTSGNDLYVRTA